MNNKNMNIVKRIAIVAQDKKKNELIEWSFNNRELLKKHQIIATAHTAYILEGTLNTEIEKLVSDNLGGYQQLGNLISAKQVDVVIFLWDPKNLLPFESDINWLLSLAEEQGIVVATNQATATALLTSEFLCGHHSSRGKGHLSYEEKQAV